MHEQGTVVLGGWTRRTCLGRNAVGDKCCRPNELCQQQDESEGKAGSEEDEAARKPRQMARKGRRR